MTQAKLRWLEGVGFKYYHSNSSLTKNAPNKKYYSQAERKTNEGLSVFNKPIIRRHIARAKVI